MLFLHTTLRIIVALWALTDLSVGVQTAVRASSISIGKSIQQPREVQIPEETGGAWTSR